MFRPDRPCKRRLGRARASKRRAGYALVIVIWGLGIIALLVVSFMTAAKLRVQSAFNIAGGAQARLIAQGAVNKAMLTLSQEQQTPQPGALGLGGTPPAGQAAAANADPAKIHDGHPLLCGFGDAAVVVAIEDEGGKVDLNAAPQALLKAMLGGFGLGLREADIAANAIVAFRTPRDAGSGQPGGLQAKGAQAQFNTIFELYQVEGIEASLVRELLPYLTVHSRLSGVNNETAPPALFAALAGYSPQDVSALEAAPFPNALDRRDPRFSNTFKQNGASGVFLLHAEARLASGQTGVQDVVIDVQYRQGLAGATPEAEPFAILELRQGSIRYKDLLRSVSPGNAGALPRC